MVIPTYEVGPAEISPVFYTRESYQGAQNRIYPYPLQDKLTHTRKERTYTALNLENEYVKLTVLPEIGGRLFAATDKTNDYDFFYRQHVIKPALVGMLGAWISGGVEWCAFHHHRNTTFMPVDYHLAENSDGSKTVWFGEIERRHRMKWLIGLTLYPGQSIIETTVKLINRTAQPHSILYWANAAVHANEDYQVIFPPSVQVATHHAKIDFTHWPISHGRYCGTDYEGIDISRYRNLPNPVSFFAWDLQEDFMGGYDHGRQAGVVHVGNHHILPGAKLWSWGNGAAGRLWDRILTDTDGPYVELMVGAFSNNQPDYSWIKPYKVKAFKHYWYPVRGIGGFKNANMNGAINLDVTQDNTVSFGLYSTSLRKDARVKLTAKDTVLFRRMIEIGPSRPYTHRLTMPEEFEESDLRVVLISSDGKELIAYQPLEQIPVAELPRPVEAPPAPHEIETVEELYLTGLQIEQIHNPSVDPINYYKEALRRDPDDSRCNTVLGVHCNRKGAYEQAETHLKLAIERLSADYTRPGNTEAYYQLGLSLRAQGKDEQAYDSFYRASWDYAWHSAATYQLAELSCRMRSFKQALELINDSLSTNNRNTKAQNVRVMILRKLGRLPKAREQAMRVLNADPLDFLAANELYLIQLASNNEAAAAKVLDNLKADMRGEVQSYLELAVDYMNCGMWDEAIDVLKRPIDAAMPFAATYPLVHYYLGYLHEQKENASRAGEYYAQARTMPSDYCFPYRLETVDVLDAAIRFNPADARAYYYFGNLMFDRQPAKAIACWEKSRALDDAFAMVHRNLGWAVYRVKDDVAQAIDGYEQTIARDRRVPRWYLELDQLYEIGNVEPQQRMAMLEPNHEIVRQNQDSLLREIMVLVLVGRYDQAIDYLTNHRFHAREGGKGIHEVYVDAHLLRGLERMKEGEWAEAINDFQQANESPENLSAPRSSRRTPEIAYHIGTAHEAAGRPDKARSFYEQGAASKGAARWPQTIYFHGLCLRKLGDHDAADRVFDQLVETGRRGLTPKETVDYFAKFGEQDTRQARIAAAHFTIGLSLLGKGQEEEARRGFEQAVMLNKSHVWARYQLSVVR
jgi:tetratricopeptide (TPR) repeat protein